MSTSGGARFPATIPVTVPDGGTGLATLGANGVLLGEGTSNVNVTTAGTSGQVLTSNGPGVDPTFQAVASGGGGLGIYGDGSDGSPTFDGSTTILGLVPSTNVYTLTRDLFLASPTINTGVTLNENGFRIFANGTLTNNGTISDNGNNASAGTAGAALTNANSSINTTNGRGTVGGTGTASAGGNGNNQSLSLGGNGGTGGSGVNGAGAAGTASAPSQVNGSVRAVPAAIFGHFFTGGTAIANCNGGCGGAGGGGDNVSGVGGGGGGGGGICIVVAKTFAGTGAVQARGGVGGNATGGVHAGGGGGGGGGVVIVVSGSASAGAITGQTIDANGGAGGTHSGTGTDGGAGVNGTKIVLQN